MTRLKKGAFTRYTLYHPTLGFVAIGSYARGQVAVDPLVYYMDEQKARNVTYRAGTFSHKEKNYSFSDIEVRQIAFHWRGK